MNLEIPAPGRQQKQSVTTLVLVWLGWSSWSRWVTLLEGHYFVQKGLASVGFGVFIGISLGVLWVFGPSVHVFLVPPPNNNTQVSC